MVSHQESPKSAEDIFFNVESSNTAFCFQVMQNIVEDILLQHKLGMENMVL
jgi:hypothetical protein